MHTYARDTVIQPTSSSPHSFVSPSFLLASLAWRLTRSLFAGLAWLLLLRVLLHGILGLHKAMPNTLEQMGKAHTMHAEMLRGTFCLF